MYVPASSGYLLSIFLQMYSIFVLNEVIAFYHTSSNVEIRHETFFLYLVFTSFPCFPVVIDYISYTNQD